MQLFITILHIFLCAALILIILLQPGKEQGAVFGGGGGGNQAYGPRGQANFLGRATTVVAVMFMSTSVSLAWMSSQRIQAGSEIEDVIKDLEAEEFGGAAEAPTEVMPTPGATPSEAPDPPSGTEPVPADTPAEVEAGDWPAAAPATEASGADAAPPAAPADTPETAPGG